MDNIKVLGIDLAKNIFQLHGADSKGKGVLRKRLSREVYIKLITMPYWNRGLWWSTLLG